MLAFAALAFGAGLLAVGGTSRGGRNATQETAAMREWSALVVPHGPDR